MRRGAPSRRPAATAPKGEGATLALRAWRGLHAVYRQGSTALRHELERDLTLPRFDLLRCLVEGGGTTLAELARRMRVTAGNVTGLVTRAARDGLVERHRDPEDRRAWRIRATPKGERAFREAERRHAARIARLLSSLTKAELAVLTRLLDRVRLRLPEPASLPSPPARPAPRARTRAGRRPASDAARRRRLA